MTMETHLEVLSDFSDETLKGQFADEKLGGLLITSDFAERNGSWAETVRLLHASSCCLEGFVSERQDMNSEWQLTAVFRADDLAASCLRGALPD